MNNNENKNKRIIAFPKNNHIKQKTRILKNTSEKVRLIK